jgi:hypothetical protein
VNVIEPNPVSVEVGDDPTSPEIVVARVLEIPDPARTANASAVPRPTAGTAPWVSGRADALMDVATNESSSIRTIEVVTILSLFIFFRPPAKTSNQMYSFGAINHSGDATLPTTQLMPSVFRSIVMHVTKTY